MVKRGCVSIIFSWDLQWARREEKKEVEGELLEEEGEVLSIRVRCPTEELLAGMGMFFEFLQQ